MGDFNFRRAESLTSLSGFANLSTKITNQREFRLSLIFLPSENNQRFQSAKVKVKPLFKVNKSIIMIDNIHY